jgi:selenide,water dikinase
MKRLVLLGGGHAHVHVLDEFARRPPENTELVLVSPQPRHIYSGMLPGWIAGFYPLDQCTLPIARLADRCGARHLQTAGTGVEPARRQVLLADGSRLDYDLISIDVGPSHDPDAIAGAGTHALPVRPLEIFVAGWQDILAHAQTEGSADLAIVGGGAGGVELALTMQGRLAREIGASQVRVRLVSASDTLLPGHASGAGKRLAGLLARRGIGCLMGRRAVAVGAEGVALDDGNSVAARRVVVATGAAAPVWPREAGLAVDGRGFILVDHRLCSPSHPEVFAAGDIASMIGHPRPKSGVYAVRAGPPLAANLRRALAGEPLRPYTPQHRALYLIGTGEAYAVASWGPFSWAGRWVWRWKDRIDRSFIARYRV